MLQWKAGDKVRNLFDCVCVSAPAQKNHRTHIAAGEIGTLEPVGKTGNFIVRFGDGKWVTFEPMVFERVIDTTLL